MTDTDRSILFFSSMGCIAAGDILLRTFPELLGLGDSFILPILTVVTFRHLVPFATIGWGLGWLLLFFLVYYFTPKLYPETILKWASSVQVRFSLALSAVGVGVLVEKTILVMMDFGTTPTPLSFPVVVGVLVGTVVLFTIASVTPPIIVLREFFPVASSSIVRLPARLRRDYSFTEFTVRGSLLAVVLGVLLAEVSLLYPLPELLVLGVVAYEGLLDGLFGGNYLPARRDVAERAAVGAVAVWGSLRHFLILGYAVSVIFLAVLFALYVFNQLPLSTALRRNPGSVLLMLSMVGATLVYTTKYSIRMLVRLPVQIHRSLNAESIPEEPEFEQENPRLSGFLIPGGVTASAFLTVFATTNSAEVVSLATLSDAQLAVCVGLVLATLLLSYRPFPRAIELSDYQVFPIATALGLNSFFFGAAYVNYFLYDGATDAPIFVGFPLFAFTAVCPFLTLTGFEYWRREPDDDTEYNIRGLAMSWGLFALVWIIIFGRVLANFLGFLPSEPSSVETLLFGAPLTVSLLWVAVTTFRFLSRMGSRALEVVMSVVLVVVFSPVGLALMIIEWLADRSIVNELRNK